MLLVGYTSAREILVVMHIGELRQLPVLWYAKEYRVVFPRIERRTFPPWIVLLMTQNVYKSIRINSSEKIISPSYISRISPMPFSIGPCVDRCGPT